MPEALVADTNNSPPIAPAASPPPASTAPGPQAGAIADAAFHRLSAADQAKYANVKKPGDQGGSEWILRDKLPAEPAATESAAAPAGDKHKIGELELPDQELRDYLTAKGEAELRKASLPASAADYKAELPENFEMPAGVTDFKIEESDPLLADARNWAHAK